MVDTHIYRWRDERLTEVEPTDSPTGDVVAADSWLVVDGLAVSMDRHLARFARGVQHASKDVSTDAFVHGALAQIPTEGRWFPRIEAIGIDDDVVLQVRVRPAPEPLAVVTLATSRSDPRTKPDVKGPDLESLGALRAELGVGEAVILDGGIVAEGAWSSIVWWANDKLHVVDPGIARLPSVTESVIRDHAAYIGSPVVTARAEPRELDGAEVWVLSALHGIRVATDWRDGPALHIEPGRADYWRQQYTNQRKVLSQA